MNHQYNNAAAQKNESTILTVRAMSGLSGDMILSGLSRLGGADDDSLSALVRAVLPEKPDIQVKVKPRSVNSIAGWGAKIDLPHEHAHRNLPDILNIIEHSALDPAAKKLAAAAFNLLAAAEGKVHGKDPAEVTFHEVGALDSILDICLSSALFCQIAPSSFVCSPLPLADGSVKCAHGRLPTPAPSVLEMLNGVAVCGFDGQGETVTPTAIALLKTFGATFGPWPDMIVESQAVTFGDKIFPGVPNGAIWAVGLGRA